MLKCFNFKLIQEQKLKLIQRAKNYKTYFSTCLDINDTLVKRVGGGQPMGLRKRRSIRTPRS